MAEIRYRIPMLSAQGILSYAKSEGDDIFSFNLNKAQTSSVISNYGETYQEDNGMFFQIMCAFHGDNYRQPKADTVIDYLFDIIIYVDFKGIFDRSSKHIKNAVRQKKAESMFRPEGITLDLGNGKHKYVAFERSASMSRNARLSFIRADFYDTVRKRITLDLDIRECELSKLYAYNGLMFSSGVRVELNDDSFWNRIVVIPNPQAVTSDVPYVSVRDITGCGGMRKYERIECTGDIETTRFDGMGLLSVQLAEMIDIKLGSDKKHTSFQIRMPYIKGMLHKVDFTSLFIEAGIKSITDIWGKSHKLSDIDIILTESQFKGCKWINQCGVSWEDFIDTCKKYRHALYITNVSKAEAENITELNYQFLNTVKMLSEQFRPDDLPSGWVNDERTWLTKLTEQRYYELLCDRDARIKFFTDKADAWTFGRKSKNYYLAQILKKNPDFINEPFFVKQLEDEAEKLLKDYSIGRLLVDGDNRFFAADIMELFCEIIKNNNGSKRLLAILQSECLKTDEFYAPGSVYSQQETYTLLRNPHIARNEEAIVRPAANIGKYRKKYLDKLTDVIMVNSTALIAERLGGADFDGDMIKTIAEPVLNRSVAENYGGDDFSYRSNLPLLSIPSAKPIIADPSDWYKRFETVKNTFSSRVGQISNAALDRSIVAYDENTDYDIKEQYRKETEILEILTGLEIDSAKSGIKPDLSEYLEINRAARTPFLKYKTLIEKSEQKRRWYETSYDERFKAYFNNTDWDNVSSNLEKLPYFARMLKKNTPKIKYTPAKASELFTFAEKQGWEKKLDPKILDYVSRVIGDYETCLKRIRTRRNAVSGIKAKHNDINRILYMQDRENDYDADDLAAGFIDLAPDRVEEIYEAIRDDKWHLMKEDDRYAFLNRFLPEEEYTQYYDIFADFRHGGYRLLSDIITEIHNYNIAENDATMHYPNDSKELKRMIDAYIKNPVGTDYRVTVAAEAARILETHIISLNMSVKYIVALGRRDFLYDAYYTHISRYVKKAR